VPSGTGFATVVHTVPARGVTDPDDPSSWQEIGVPAVWVEVAWLRIDSLAAG
jgi:hypothetical protein